MAQNITLLGASYPDVPSVVLPKTGGGTASFTDVTDTTATAADVASGKYFYTAAGVKTEGTSSGGGGQVVVVDTTDPGGGTIRTITATEVSLQAKTNISPTESSQTIEPDQGYTGLSSVQINAIPSNYVGSGITQRSSSDLSASGDTVTVPAGYYSSAATKAVASGTAGTPTATKGTVSNHSISVTPSVTNTTGYITGSTKTGTAVTVSASELVSGSETKTANGTYDVTNLASLVVNVSGGGGGIGTLLNTTSIGTVNTTSTQAASLNVSCSVSNIDAYDLLIVESSVNSVTNGRHTCTVGLIFLTASSAVGTKNGATVATVKLNMKASSTGTTTTSASTIAYGIYPNSCSISSGTATIPMYRRYNSTSTGTINGTYTARVYGVKLYDLIGG